ncbi:peptidoglycan-binding domain-containing protein [Alkalibacillus haloalkaliphilus]|nr:peptidoglycan-binding domain-containing protein [Alkalibacillus haloalkaliphilus]
MKSLGYFNQNSTAYYGSITSQSVREFQRDYGLNVSGKPIKRLNMKLNAP